MFRVLRELIVKVKDYLVETYYLEMESIDNFYRVHR